MRLINRKSNSLIILSNLAFENNQILITDSVQKIVEMDPKLFEDCALYGNHCPNCTIGRGDYMCQRIGSCFIFFPMTSIVLITSYNNIIIKI